MGDLYRHEGSDYPQNDWPGYNDARASFKKFLSVLSATPEQINKAGGSRAFVDHLGLAGVFPEKYVAPGESEEEQQQKKTYLNHLQVKVRHEIVIPILPVSLKKMVLSKFRMCLRRLLRKRKSMQSVSLSS